MLEPEADKNRTIMIGRYTGPFYAILTGICCNSDYCDKAQIEIRNRLTNKIIVTFLPGEPSIDVLRKFALVLAKKLSEDTDFLESLQDDFDYSQEVK